MNTMLQKTLIFSFFAAVTAYSLHDIANLDIWYHLKSGEIMVDHLEILRTNTFSSIAADRPFHDFYWLFQVIVYVLHSISGTNGLIFFKIILLTVSFFLLFAMRKEGDGYLLPVFSLLLAMMAASERFVIRPELASSFFLVLSLYILRHYREHKGQLIYLLIPVQIIWGNMHGFWVLGLFLTWAFIFGELILWRVPLPFAWKEKSAVQGKDYWRLLIVGLLVTGATLITPYPQKILHLPLEMFGALKGSIGRGGPLVINELISPFSANPFFFWQSIFYYKVLVAVSAIGFVLNLRRINIIHLVLYVGFLYLSVKARRNMGVFALVVAPITFWNLGSFYRDYCERFTRDKKVLIDKIRALLSAGLIMAVVFLIYDAASDRYYIRDRSNKRFGFGVSRISYPERAIDFIQAHNIKGNLFNDPAIGHYITWRCFPEHKAFLDGRFDFPERFLSHYYVPELWPRISEQYNINYAVLGHGRSPDLAGLIRALYFHKDWVLIYYDEMAVVFIKNIQENQPIIDQFQVVFDDSADAGIVTNAPPGNLFGVRDLPVAQFQLGNLYATLGLHTMAIKKYAECIDISPEFWEVHINLGDMYRKVGRIKDALQHYRTAVAAEPDFVAGYVRTGDLYAGQGNVREAIVSYNEAVTIKPGFVQAHRKLASLFMQLKDYEKAMRAFEIVLKLDPNDGTSRRMLDYCRRAGN